MSAPAESSVPPSRRTALRRAAPGAVVAVLAAGVLVLLGRWRLPQLILGVAAASLLLAVVVPRASLWWTRALGRAGSRIGSALLLVAAAVAGVLVVVPLWALNALARLDPLDDGWRPVRSAWRRRPDAHRPDGVASGSARMGAHEHLTGPGKRTGRVIRAAVVIVAVAGIAALVVAVDAPEGTATTPESATVADVGPGPTPAVAYDPDAVEDGRPIWDGRPLSSYAHEDEPWIEDHIHQLKQVPYRWDPFLATRPGDYTSPTVNVREGRRVTYQPKDPELTVWYFGGSTMFGIGQRDEHTIPSEIARLAEADGMAVRSENYGVPAWVNWQGTLLLQELLMTREPPDLIVFYDGANEVGAAADRLTRGDRDPRHTWRLTIAEEEQAMRDDTYPVWTDDPLSSEEFASVAAPQYRRGVALGDELGERAGVPVVHFWQPTPRSKAYAASDGPLFDHLNLARPPIGERADTISETIFREADTDAIDVSDALDGIEVPVFFDWSHTNELGARTVAAALYEHLRPQMEQLISQG